MADIIILIFCCIGTDMIPDLKLYKVYTYKKYIFIYFLESGITFSINSKVTKPVKHNK